MLKGFKTGNISFKQVVVTLTHNSIINGYISSGDQVRLQDRRFESSISGDT